MYTNDREAYRRAFLNAWQKHLHHEALEAYEKDIVQVILDHPEYHSALNLNESAHYELEENPFLHMGLHIAVREQYRIDFPIGIRGLFKQIMEQSLDQHHAEHKVMTYLGKMIWQGQQNGEMPNQDTYLKLLRTLA